VLTAITLTTDVSSRYPDMIIGETVGFQTGPISNSPRSGLVYATAGVLAVQLRNQDDSIIMDLYRFILVDEAHERSLESDMSLMLLRNFYKRNTGNRRLPFLMLTSATFDTNRYAKYFDIDPQNVIEVVGRAYAIETHWPTQGTNNYPLAAAETAIRIHEEHPDDPPEKADILIFMPGAAESKLVAAELQKVITKYAEDESGIGPFLVLIINREVVITQKIDFSLVFEKPENLPKVNGRHPLRRIVIASVVAETGVTIDTLRYVIDCGWVRNNENYQPWGVTGLTTRPTPQSRIRQRKGRAGRLFPGDFYPLYTEHVHSELDVQQLPDIITTGSANIHLAIVREVQHQNFRLGFPGEFRVEDMTLLDPPPPEVFLAVNATAIALGFVSAQAPLPTSWPPVELIDAVAVGSAKVSRGYGLTSLGQIAAMFSRTSMEGIRILLAGYVHDVSASDLITAVAMFGKSTSDLYEGRPKSGGPLPHGAMALRAALPSFLLHRVGGGDGAAAEPPTEKEAFYFRARLLVADDFAEAAILFDAFTRQLDTTSGDVSRVAEWCGEIGLDYNAMIDLARARDTIIEEMIVAGLNPYRGSERRLVTLEPGHFTNGIRNFKKCLYDGLRLKCLEYDENHPDGPGYISAQGLRVKVPILFTDAMASRLKALRVTRDDSSVNWKPRWIITDEIRLKVADKRPEEPAQPLLFTAVAGLMSVLDGYVDPDPSFILPREFA